MILVNGCPTEVTAIADRGLHYGDGLFETLAVRDEKALDWERHLHRLHQGCNRLGIPCPGIALLSDEARQAMQGVGLGVLKLIITRGSGGRGYLPPPNPTPTRIVARYPWPDYPAENRQGIILRICKTRLGTNPALAGIKHLNRLEQILARNEWDDPAIQEGVMLDTLGRVIEGTMSNLFLITDSGLTTPDIAEAGVAGIVRALILEIGRSLGLAVNEKTVLPRDLSSAAELFVCNSIIGVWPVKKLNDRTYVVGKVTRQIQARLLAQGHVVG
ncbi:MAG: aminodeoxychorismate lyase [Gammaproteobacteria bacterium]|nr:aminodeoxychorismate lyase [Gammaproteobacteria bacterium]